MKVLAAGSVRVYERGGNYQLNIMALEPSGVGALQMAFEKLKEKLAREGLFDEARKRPLPAFPGRIGIVTSPTGAALRDIVNIVRRRMPSAALVLNPVAVQGEGAAGGIARAIREFNEYGRADLLIVGRGGGSLEDLWAFNEEAVARAIAGSHIPVISAVGHETDFTIADFAADLRAPTPSAAAELAVPDRDELVLRVKSLADAVARGLERAVEEVRERLAGLSRCRLLVRPQEITEPYCQRLDDLMRIFQVNFRARFDAARGRLTAAAGKLAVMNPAAVLARGYSVTKWKGRILTDAGRVGEGETLETTLARGTVYSTVIRREGVALVRPQGHLIRNG
jgi:exodeoxyribonuclease VII large subunit